MPPDASFADMERAILKYSPEIKVSLACGSEAKHLGRYGPLKSECWLTDAKLKTFIAFDDLRFEAFELVDFP